jgi:hypothetical protein
MREELMKREEEMTRREQEREEAYKTREEELGALPALSSLLILSHHPSRLFFNTI